jgi:hypothetical protein
MLFLANEIEAGFAVVLGEYGFTTSAYQYAVGYLILLGVIINLVLIKQKASFVRFPERSNVKGDLNVFGFIYLSISVAVYASIIGINALMTVRPNSEVGGTFGTTLVLSAGIYSIVPILLDKVNLLTWINLFIAISIIYLSGTRIYLIYLLFTLGMSMVKNGVIRVTWKSLVLVGIAGFLILIVGQSFKEYYGENIVFGVFSESYQYTLDHFYTSQTEAFVSFASVVQYHSDGQPFFFNFGTEILNGLHLLIPGFLKDLVGINKFVFRSYNYSIIPSAANSFFQCFGVLGLFFHGLSVFYVNRLYLFALKMKVSSLEDVLKFTFVSYLIGVVCVLLTRGPLDLIVFNLVPIAVFLFTFYIIGKLVTPTR